jgi:hypothetical protein
MKKTLAKLLIGCLVLGAAVSVWAWYGPGGATFLTITRVTTSETRTLDYMPAADGGFDLPETDAVITENYGGTAFINGQPCQIEVYITSPPDGTTWDEITLQYFSGGVGGSPIDTGADTGSWTTIGTITDADELVDIENVKGCHFGQTWTPPAAGDYLLRIYGHTASGFYTSDTLGEDITAKGNALTWYNFGVVEFTVTSNTRPGY